MLEKFLGLYKSLFKKFYQLRSKYKHIQEFPHRRKISALAKYFFPLINIIAEVLAKFNVLHLHDCLNFIKLTCKKLYN